MTLNATELAAVADDLSARLHGAVVQRVREHLIELGELRPRVD